MGVNDGVTSSIHSILLGGGGCICYTVVVPFFSSPLPLPISANSGHMTYVCTTSIFAEYMQFHLPTHMHINAAIERDDGRSEKGDVRENMHMTNNLATSCKKNSMKNGGRKRRA